MARLAILALGIFFLLPSNAYAAESHTIRITPAGYFPERLEVAAGDTVVFINEDEVPHWPASDLHPTHTSYPGSDIRSCGTSEEGDVFDACRSLEKGKFYSFTFTAAGIWRFHDHLYPNLGGTIEVQGEAEEQREERGQSSLNVVEKFSAFFLHWWYLLPTQADKRKLDKLDVAHMVNDDAELEFWMRVFGHERLFEALLVDMPALESKVSAKKDAVCHTQAHYLGRMAYKLGALDVEDEHTIDTRCQFGFYHGVIESSLGNLGDENTLKKLGTQCARYTLDLMQRINCFHIVGHGIMLSENYNLPVAIEKCYTFFEKKLDVGICYHGVFMENIFAGIDINVLEGHQTSWVDPARPHLPCDSNEIPSYPGVREYCYFNQSILWAEEPLEDFNELNVFERCSQAEVGLHYMCFGGAGSNMVLFTTLTDTEIIEKCDNAPDSTARKDCLLGALYLRNTPVWESQGFRNETYCQALGQPDIVRCGLYVDRALSWLIAPTE